MIFQTLKCSKNLFKFRPRVWISTNVLAIIIGVTKMLIARTLMVVIIVTAGRATSVLVYHVWKVAVVIRYVGRIKSVYIPQGLIASV